MLNALETKQLIEPEIFSVFNEIKHYLYPSYRYLQGNCHSNAHFGSLILKRHNIPHKKIWVFAPCRYSLSSNEVFLIQDPNYLAPKGYIRWGYHVAPVVEIENREFIFDFNFSETAPLNLDKWLSHLNSNNYKCVLEDPDHFLFYSSPSAQKPNRNLFNGGFYRLEGICQENKWFEKGLAANETAYTMYEEVIRPAIERNAPLSLINDYKHLIGSINNFECVFRDHSHNRKMTSEFQQKHGNLINYYRGVFEDNICKWSVLIKDLTR